MMDGIAGTLAAGPAAELVAAAFGAVVPCAALMRNLMRKRKRDPLAGLFAPETLASQIDNIAKRSEVRRVVLHGQRAQMARLRAIWADDIRGEAMAEVARVMRAGQRRAGKTVVTLRRDTKPLLAEWDEVLLLPPPASAVEPGEARAA
jgi:hypothetical protein